MKNIIVTFVIRQYKWSITKPTDVCMAAAGWKIEPNITSSLYCTTQNINSGNNNSSTNSTITSITNDGVIVTVNAKRTNSNITGYYFSYTNERPNKNTGGYIATNKETIDIVRLPGTTYVWVEYQTGDISNYKSITLSNDVLLNTISGSYTILKDMKLSEFLKNKGWSIEELNKLIARSVRAAGLYTKDAAATAAVSLQTVLAQKYQIKIPYWMGGKPGNLIGAHTDWGKYYENPTYEGYYYYGLDCDGFTNWSYTNAGLVLDTNNNHYWYWDRIPFSKENGEIGDLIAISNDTTNHVNIIVGKTNTGFIVAHAVGKSHGLAISTHAYSDTKDYEIIKGDWLIEQYSKISTSDYPSGF